MLLQVYKGSQLAVQAATSPELSSPLLCSPLRLVSQLRVSASKQDLNLALALSESAWHAFPAHMHCLSLLVQGRCGLCETFIFALRDHLTDIVCVHLPPCSLWCVSCCRRAGLLSSLSRRVRSKPGNQYIAPVTDEADNELERVEEGAFCHK